MAPRNGPTNTITTMPRKPTKTVDQEIEEYRDKRRKAHGELVRESIQTSQLVNVLQQFALGKGNTKMTAIRLKSIEMLLDKSMPDLASIKHDVEVQHVTFNINTEYTKPVEG
jgi:hypothetical protein